MFYPSNFRSIWRVAPFLVLAASVFHWMNPLSRFHSWPWRPLQFFCDRLLPYVACFPFCNEHFSVMSDPQFFPPSIAYAYWISVWTGDFANNLSISCTFVEAFCVAGFPRLRYTRSFTRFSFFLSQTNPPLMFLSLFLVLRVFEWIMNPVWLSSMIDTLSASCPKPI